MQTVLKNGEVLTLQQVECVWKMRRWLSDNELVQINHSCTDRIYLSGTVTKEPQYLDYLWDEQGEIEFYYCCEIESARKSQEVDVINVFFSDKICDPKQIKEGVSFLFSGKVKTKNEKGHLIVMVELVENPLKVVKGYKERDVNEARIIGTICKKPIYRETPSGIKITDITIAVNDREYSYYLPCIAWNKTAKRLGKATIGQKIMLYGRLQSREYSKKLKNDVMEKQIAREFSISRYQAIFF